MCTKKTGKKRKKESKREEKEEKGGLSRYLYPFADATARVYDGGPKIKQNVAQAEIKSGSRLSDPQCPCHFQKEGRSEREKVVSHGKQCREINLRGGFPQKLHRCSRNDQ